MLTDTIEPPNDDAMESDDEPRHQLHPPINPMPNSRSDAIPSTLIPRGEEGVVLERWLQEKKTSPMTNLPLKTTAVVPNIALRKAIEKWEEIAHEYAINANS